MEFQDALSILGSPSRLLPEDVGAALDFILQGRWTNAQVAGFLVALRLKGETPELISAAARACRKVMVPVHHHLPCVLDTCGTGGDQAGTLNLSTAAAVVVAANGVPVAKHGNRAVSSRCGSADVLEALGISLDVPSGQQAEVLTRAGIAFLFAPHHQPMLRHAAQARKELGIRTLFNLLGPLSNPARATHQLLGTGDNAMRVLFAQTLRELGTERAWVVSGIDGLDEVSPCAATRVTELDRGRLNEFTLTPEDFGLPRSTRQAIAGGDANENALALRAIFSGEQHPARTAVVLNAAAALVVAKRLTLRDAACAAEHSLASGAADRTLSTWKSTIAALRVQPEVAQ